MKIKWWVIACAPCDEDYIVRTYGDKPEYCPMCGDCDCTVWEKQTEELQNNVHK